MNGEIANTLIGGAINLLATLLVVWFKHSLANRGSTQSSALAMTTLLLVVLGFAMGAAASGLRDQFASFDFYYGSRTAEWVLVLTCLALVLSRRGSQAEVLLYQVEVLALWGPFVAGWLLFNRNPGWVEPFTGWAIVFYLGCAVIGGGIVAILKVAPASPKD